jgi:hypothetical protein
VSQVELIESPVEVVWVSIADLAVGSSFRDSGLCPEHVDHLVGLAGSWPPIVVGHHGAVVDGAHRVAAARRLGLARVEAVLFSGSAEAAFVEFVRRNVTHGLLLTLSERKRAAVRVLRSHSRWSDRRVAEVCGLSPKTVGRLRAEACCPSEESSQVDGRIGRDDRVRPVRREPVRARVLAALRELPDGSLRQVAAVAGVSPETVRLVRLNMAQVPSQVEVCEAADATEPILWRDDHALLSSAQGDAFLEWFERTAVEEADVSRVGSVPLSRAYQIADEARRRADIWQQFASGLENRTTRRKSQ